MAIESMTREAMGREAMGREAMGREAMGKAGRSTRGDSRHAEGTLARSIEEQTAKLPSDLFLWAAVGSIVGSLALQYSGRKEESLFVGQWAPTLLILGLYNKLVKVAGSDGACE